MSKFNLSFSEYNREQTQLSRNYQRRIAHNCDIDTSGKWWYKSAMKTEDVLLGLSKIGIITITKTLQRYARNYDLIPMPETVGLGKNHGRITIYHNDTIAEFAASYSLRENSKIPAKKIAEARQIVKEIEGTIERIEDLQNCSQTVDGREYRYLINAELGDLIISGGFGTTATNDDGTVETTPYPSVDDRLLVMLAQIWITNKIKALAGFNPMKKAVEYSFTKTETHSIVYIFERKQ